MYKQSPGRNQRSQGIKVKHVLQICLLLAVCFWLIYQVKHSHDKKKEFDENDAKKLLDSVRKDEVVKLGRKDLHPLKESTIVENDKHSEEVEDEEIEEETSEEEKKHEDEGEQNKAEADDKNDEERGGEEEELDGHDQEKSDMENDREDEFVDKEKEREDDDEQDLEDKDFEDNNGQTYTGGASQEHDIGGDTARRHEARDENYKADDASSAVTLDTQTTSTGNERVVLRKSNEQGDVNNLEPRNNFNQKEGVDAGQSESVNVEGGETTNKDHLGTTTNEQSKTIISNSSVTEMSTTQSNLTDESVTVQDFSLLNDNGTVSENNEDQRVVEDHTKSNESSKLEISDPNLKDNSTLPVNSDLQGFNSTGSSESKSTNPEIEDSHTHSVTESSNSEMKYNMTSESEDNSSITENSSLTENPQDDEDNSSITENSSLTENPQDDEASQINENLDKKKSENSYDVNLNTEDSFDSKLSLEEKDVRTDLETLPDIDIEGSNIEDDVAAE
ncbi:hypothetical protein LIER_11664 [Lithospermum erythrorhizon]|uniref:Uncharacterized protein n=1 Tax=Lithospermum erythrorhizon TaxID=34254 RepID=A0AAV3PQF8_LITER